MPKGAGIQFGFSLPGLKLRPKIVLDTPRKCLEALALFLKNHEHCFKIKSILILLLALSD